MDAHDHSDSEDGFTIIELMIVVGIIAVLIAIMIPTLLRAKTPAQDRQAQNLLRNSLTAAKSVETDERRPPNAILMAEEEGGVTFVAPSTTAPRGAAVGVGRVHRRRHQLVSHPRIALVLGPLLRHCSSSPVRSPSSSGSTTRARARPTSSTA